MTAQPIPLSDAYLLYVTTAEQDEVVCTWLASLAAELSALSEEDRGASDTHAEVVGLSGLDAELVDTLTHPGMERSLISDALDIARLAVNQRRSA